MNQLKELNTMSDDERLRVNHALGLLNQVMDPEIPVVSVVELGMVRNITILDEVVQVTITPTFSGCPAQDVINELVVDALQDFFEKVELIVTLDPPWNVNDIDENCFIKLKQYGIAPPVLSNEPLTCPLCNSSKVEQISFFGATACKSQYRCLECLEPFEYFKALGKKNQQPKKQLTDKTSKIRFIKDPNCYDKF